MNYATQIHELLHSRFAELLPCGLQYLWFEVSDPEFVALSTALGYKSNDLKDLINVSELLHC